MGHYVEGLEGCQPSSLARAPSFIPPQSKRLPQAPYTISIKELFDGNERQISGQRLRDEHPVERVLKRTRQPPGAHGVIHGYQRFLEALAGYRPSNVQGQRLYAGEFAETVLGRYLPGRRCAD